MINTDSSVGEPRGVSNPCHHREASSNRLVATSCFSKELVSHFFCTHPVDIAILLSVWASRNVWKTSSIEIILLQKWSWSSNNYSNLSRVCWRSIVILSSSNRMLQLCVHIFYEKNNSCRAICFVSYALTNNQ